MKLVIYLYKKFFASFLLSLLFFILALCLTDLFINLWNYISRSVPARTILYILFLYVPKALWYSVPIAVLFATAYTLSDLYARNELISVFVAGISLLRFTFPLLVIGMLFSFALFSFEDNVVVKTYAQKTELQRKVLHRQQSLNNDNIVIMAEEGSIIYKADYFDNELKRLFNFYVIFRTNEKEAPDNEKKNFIAIIYAESATWKDEKWVLSNPICYLKTPDGIKVQEPDSSLLDRITELPETFRNNTISVEEVNTKEAREYIAYLQRSGLPSDEARSLYHKKFAFPFIVFIVVFLAIGLSGKTRKNVLLISLALSISAVVVYYVFQMLTMLMAKFGVLPAFLGPWLPVIFFIFVSVVLLHYAKT